MYSQVVWASEWTVHMTASHLSEIECLVDNLEINRSQSFLLSSLSLHLSPSVCLFLSLSPYPQCMHVYLHMHICTHLAWVMGADHVGLLQLKQAWELTGPSVFQRISWGTCLKDPYSRLWESESLRQGLWKLGLSGSQRVISPIRCGDAESGPMPSLYKQHFSHLQTSLEWPRITQQIGNRASMWIPAQVFSIILGRFPWPCREGKVGENHNCQTLP